MGKWVKGYPKTSRKGQGFETIFWLPQPIILLYIDSSNNHGQEYPDQFKYDYAVSREDKNAAGQKMCLYSFYRMRW